MATAGRKVASYDTRDLSKPIEERITALKFSTTSLATMPGAEGTTNESEACKAIFIDNTASLGYSVGSVEGRVGIEYFDKAPAVQAQKYAFKCHRQTVPEGDLVFDVHALAFHPM